MVSTITLNHPVHGKFVATEHLVTAVHTIRANPVIGDTVSQHRKSVEARGGVADGTFDDCGRLELSIIEASFDHE